MIWRLIKFEWKNDIRNTSSIIGILLYIFTVLFFCLQSFIKTPDAMVWNNLFWVVLIFSAINATSKNFSQYNRGRFIYLYTTVKPEHFIVAKILYTILFMLVITVITVFVYAGFFGFGPLYKSNLHLYILTLLLGTVGFAAILAFMSVLAVRANAGNALTAILSIPLLIPLVLSVTELSRLAINNLPWDLAQSSLTVASCVDALVIALAYVLFPYLWRE
ncbi:MAG TPA: heme exporter protein CcmB [Flavobacteriales bacterium]|nr:heme exporter protein CcmB [Flavobacteriales bacterium]